MSRAAHRSNHAMRTYCLFIILGAAAAVLGEDPGPWRQVNPSIDLDHCGPHHLLRPCPPRCSLALRPVYAVCEDGHLRRFLNCCAWRRDVCFYKRKCTFSHEEPVGDKW
ncbi:uncharacterized protein LOC126188793 [Schistocerca cancellata]|uniref:uncharacterized protein LOC126188793 n=1 Tax=Schistocerca cancellata TaxID=274614 RepID=UPI002118F486|nr:uncharacterized protein LOC126188793 [Schistocerca cancellata]